MLEKILIAQFRVVEIKTQNSILLYIEALKLDFKYLKQLHTHYINLNYLQRKLKYVLNYKYTICNIYLQTLKLKIKSYNLYFRVNKSVIYSQKIFTIKRVKFVTIDFKILSINNNNTRDIVSLKFFRLLQNVFKLALFI